ncbi:MAG: c-type cytochrome [Proteobacteria bacterium]|nr:c-type cytochrome [Pseudomonadota bacterium]
MKSHKLKLVPLFLLIIFPITVLAEPPLAYEGKRLFTTYCYLCHGVDGKGGGPLAKSLEVFPADLTRTVRVRSDIVLKKIITGEGRQFVTGQARHNIINDAMPKWGKIFSAHQVDALISYLRFISTSKHPLLGDPELGLTLYQKYCVVCHGEEGEGDGPMTKIMPIEPMDHSNPNEINNLSNEDLRASILFGTDRNSFMPAWEGILTKLEIEALISYIRLLAA